MQDIRGKFAEIRIQLEKKVFHPYLLKYIETPVIDEDKLLILISIMDELDLSREELQNYALTTMLIQIALDTHEHVSKGGTRSNQKEQQLTVLAGDYYSGLYYKLLADSNDILMIKELAKGIKEVNEHKIFIYQKNFDGVESLFESLKMVEGSLLNRLADYFQLGKWKEYASNVLLLKRLLAEKKQFVEAGTSLLFEALRMIIFPKSTAGPNLTVEQQHYLITVCDRYIEFFKEIIETRKRQFPYINEVLEKRVASLLNQHQPAKICVEEG